MKKFFAWIASWFQSKPAPVPAPQPPLTIEVPKSRPDLSRGDKGEHVLALQKMLKAKGYEVPTTGTFDASTESGVKKFQAAAGLKLQFPGTVGPLTWSALEKPAAPTPTPTPKPPVGAVTLPYTKDLVNRKNSTRKVPEYLRLEIEKIVFKNGVIPQAFLKKDVPQMVRLLSLALVQIKIREVGGNNRGFWVGMLQSVIGSIVYNLTGKTGGNGEAWCMSTMQVIIAFIEDYLKVESDIISSEHCMTTIREARKISGLTTMTAEVGTIIIWRHGTTESGHTGSIMAVGSKLSTVEGNTGDSSMRDGDGLFERTRSPKGEGDMTIQGYIRLYTPAQLKAIQAA